MPAKSRSQQRLFGAVLNCRRNNKCASPEVSKIASSISDKDAEDFARTKHDKLPERKKKKGLKSYREFIENQNLTGGAKQVAGMMMGGSEDPWVKINNAQKAGVSNVKDMVAKSSKWFDQIQQAFNQQGGEQANQALETLQAIVIAAASGVRGGMSQQAHNLQNVQQQPQPQQQQPNIGGGSTPN